MNDIPDGSERRKSETALLLSAGRAQIFQLALEYSERLRTCAAKIGIEQVRDPEERAERVMLYLAKGKQWTSLCLNVALNLHARPAAEDDENDENETFWVRVDGYVVRRIFRDMGTNFRRMMTDTLISSAKSTYSDCLGTDEIAEMEEALERLGQKIIEGDVPVPLPTLVPHDESYSASPLAGGI